MLGVDIVAISRFKDADIKLAKRFLHPIELKAYEKSENKAKFLAKHWAIKEAIFKCDNTFSQFNEILIIIENRKAKFKNFEISTSNENDLYIAIARKDSND